MAKRAIILLVVILMLIPLYAACGNTSTNQSSPETTVISLKYSSPYQVAEDPTRFGYYFMDYVEKKSNGRVKFERFPGAVLGTAAEHLDLVKSNSIDLASIGQRSYVAQIPVLGYLNASLGSSKNVVNFQNKLNFEISETSAILGGELENNNLKILCFFPTGIDGIIAKQEFHSIADLAGKKVGVDGANQPLQILGLNPVNVIIPDMYESLSRGVIDCSNLSLTAMISLKWYEVTNCFMSNNSFNAGQTLAVNSTTFNGLPNDIQAIFLEAATATSQYAVELDEENIDQNLQILEDAGLITGKLPESECEEWYNIRYDQTKAEMLAACEKLGKGEEAQIIYKYADQILGGN